MLNSNKLVTTTLLPSLTHSTINQRNALVANNKDGGAWDVFTIIRCE